MHSRAQADSAFLGAGDHPLLPQKGKKVLCLGEWALDSLVANMWNGYQWEVGKKKQVLMIDDWWSNTIF